MKKKITFHPELILDLGIGANEKHSSVKIQTAKDAIVVFDAIKKLTTDHIVLIYLNKDDVIVEVDTFLMDLKTLFDPPHPNQIIAKIGWMNNTGRADKVIIAQNFSKLKNPNQNTIDINELIMLALKIGLINIQIFDCILIGQEGYFSFKEDGRDWNKFIKRLANEEKINSVLRKVIKGD